MPIKIVEHTYFSTFCARTVPIIFGNTHSCSFAAPMSLGLLENVNLNL